MRVNQYKRILNEYYIKFEKGNELHVLLKNHKYESVNR